MTSRNDPSQESLIDRLAHIRGRFAYIVPMTWESGRALGNNGDRLMHAVFRSVLGALEIKEVSSSDNADVVIVPPNGALLDTYSFPRILMDRLVGLENLPLCIFPSSAYFAQNDPSEIFKGRRAETLWFLREGNSFAHLQDRWGESLARANVSLVLDHDVVASAGPGLAAHFPPVSAGEYMLVAARADREASASALKQPSSGGAAPLLQRLMSKTWQALPSNRLGTKIARQLRAASSKSQAATLLARVPGTAWSELGLDSSKLSSLTQVSLDASSPKLATYEHYLALIAGANVVVSDRLHVALPAALLGKRTVMLEAGYHKLGGVYERSLTHIENLRYIPR